MTTPYQSQLSAVWLDFSQKKNNQLKLLLLATLTARSNFSWTYEFVTLLNIFWPGNARKDNCFVTLSKPLCNKDLLDAIFIEASTFHSSLDFQ